MFSLWFLVLIFTRWFCLSSFQVDLDCNVIQYGFVDTVVFMLFALRIIVTVHTDTVLLGTEVDAGSRPMDPQLECYNLLTVCSLVITPYKWTIGTVRFFSWKLPISITDVGSSTKRKFQREAENERIERASGKWETLITTGRKLWNSLHHFYNKI